MNVYIMHEILLTTHNGVRINFRSICDNYEGGWKHGQK